MDTIDKIKHEIKMKDIKKTEKNIIYIKDLPPEIGAVVKYMLKLNEDERLEFMSKVFSCGKKDK